MKFYAKTSLIKKITPENHVTIVFYWSLNQVSVTHYVAIILRIVLWDKITKNLQRSGEY